MPEVEYVTTMNAPPAAVWDFVKDMNNWAPFLTGYQKHEIIDDTDSIWTLKGNVGILSRVVTLKAHVIEWNGPERVSFTLTGINEAVEGGGTLVMGPYKPLAVTEKPKRVFFLRRIGRAINRFFFRLMNRKTKAPKRLKAGADGAPPASQLQFTLRMDAGGPTGPLVNAMLAPALLPAAEDLANKIAAHVEKMHAAGEAAAEAAGKA
jgi:Polyketide cyclase / dehydrase and lipid transport